MDDLPRPAKRPKLSSSRTSSTASQTPSPPQPRREQVALASLHRSITPPRSSSNSTPRHEEKGRSTSESTSRHKSKPQVIPSPFQLTHIRDLPRSSNNNVDTIRLGDILGDPMIRECWQFNYLFDVDFLMSQFDEDVRALVQVKVVHGSWKREAPNRVRIDEACARYPNAEAIVAYMPEPFGTHHSKMMILLRHDDLAQVIIHTANMIPGDWANMCQGVWRSPLLPLRKPSTSNSPGSEDAAAFGSGARFKRDLLAYLREYGLKKTGSLVNQLAQYDFSAVRAALVASVPSKQKLDETSDCKQTLWGWPALRDALCNVPIAGQGKPRTTPHIVTQISSVATLGQQDKWLKEVFFESLSATTPSAAQKPEYSIIFPTADEIRRSLNGYGSGGSIHMKLQSAAQQKQLEYMRPYLCHWAGDQANAVNSHRLQDAGRRRAAPHIKTYIRFSNTETMDTIDWAMLTSANLSTQAWGAAVNRNGEVRICSWEMGVLVWPELLAGPSPGSHPTLVPCFKRDVPDDLAGSGMERELREQQSTVIGLRMPYDLPLSPYAPDAVPWCATADHTEPDWLGQTWLVEEP